MDFLKTGNLQLQQFASQFAIFPFLLDMNVIFYSKLIADVLIMRRIEEDNTSKQRKAM